MNDGFMTRIDRILQAIKDKSVDTGGLPALIGDVAENYVDMSESIRAMLLRDLGEKTDEVSKSLGYQRRITEQTGNDYNIAAHVIRQVNQVPTNYGNYVGSFIDYINGLLGQKGLGAKGTNSFTPARAQELASGSRFSDQESAWLRSVGVDPHHIEMLSGVRTYGDVAQNLQRHFAPGWVVMGIGADRNGGDLADYLSNTSEALTTSVYGYDWKKQRSQEGSWIPTLAGNYVYSSIYAAGRKGQNEYINQTSIERSIREANFGGSSSTTGKMGSDVTTPLREALGATLSGRSVGASLFETLTHYFGISVQAGTPISDVASILEQHLIGGTGTAKFNPAELNAFIQGRHSNDPEMLTGIQEIMKIAREKYSALGGFDRPSSITEDQMRGQSTSDAFEELMAKQARVPFYLKEISPTPMPFLVKKENATNWFEIVNGIPKINGEVNLNPIVNGIRQTNIKWANPSLEEQKIMSDAIAHSRYNDPVARQLFARYDINFTPASREQAIKLLGDIRNDPFSTDVELHKNAISIGGVGVDILANTPNGDIGIYPAGNTLGSPETQPNQFYLNQRRETQSVYKSIVQPVLTQSDMDKLKPFLKQMKDMEDRGGWHELAEYGKSHPDAYRLYKEIYKMVNYDTGSLGGTNSAEWEVDHGDYFDMDKNIYDGNSSALWRQADSIYQIPSLRVFNQDRTITQEDRRTGHTNPDYYNVDPLKTDQLRINPYWGRINPPHPDRRRLYTAEEIARTPMELKEGTSVAKSYIGRLQNFFKPYSLSDIVLPVQSVENFFSEGSSRGGVPRLYAGIHSDISEEDDKYVRSYDDYSWTRARHDTERMRSSIQYPRTKFFASLKYDAYLKSGQPAILQGNFFEGVRIPQSEFPRSSFGISNSSWEGKYSKYDPYTLDTNPKNKSVDEWFAIDDAKRRMRTSLRTTISGNFSTSDGIPGSTEPSDSVETFNTRLYNADLPLPRNKRTWRQYREPNLQFDDEAERQLATTSLTEMNPEYGWLLRSARGGRFYDSDRPRRRFEIASLGTGSRPDWDINENLSTYFTTMFLQQHGREGVSVTDYLHNAYGLKESAVELSKRRNTFSPLLSSPKQIDLGVESVLRNLIDTDRSSKRPLGADAVPLYFTAADKWTTAIFGYEQLNAGKFSQEDLAWWKRKTLSSGISPVVQGLSVDDMGVKHLDPRNSIDLTRGLPPEILRTESSTRENRMKYLADNFWRITSRPFVNGKRQVITRQTETVYGGDPDNPYEEEVVTTGISERNKMSYDQIFPDEVAAMLPAVMGMVDVSKSEFSRAIEGETSVLRGNVVASRTAGGMQLFSGLRGQKFEFSSGEEKYWGRVSRDFDISNTGNSEIPFELLPKQPTIGMTGDILSLLPGAKAGAPNALEFIRDMWRGASSEGRKDIDEYRKRLPIDMLQSMRDLPATALTDTGYRAAADLLYSSTKGRVNSEDQVLQDFMGNFFGQKLRRKDDYGEWLYDLPDEDYKHFGRVWGTLQYELVQNKLAKDANGGHYVASTSYSDRVLRPFMGDYRREFGEEYWDKDKNPNLSWFEQREKQGRNVRLYRSEFSLDDTPDSIWPHSVSGPNMGSLDWDRYLRRSVQLGDLERGEINHLLKASAPMYHDTSGDIPVLSRPQRTGINVPMRAGFQPAIDAFARGQSSFLFSPTGSGKTRGMEEAVKVGVEAGRMVTIVTSPTTTLADQTAKAFRDTEGYWGGRSFHAFGDPGESSSAVDKQRYELETGLSTRALKDSVVDVNGQLQWKDNRPAMLLSMSEQKAGAVLSGKGSLGRMMRKLAQAGLLQVLTDEAHGFFDPNNESLPSTLNIRDFGNVPFFGTTATITEDQDIALRRATGGTSTFVGMYGGSNRKSTLDFGIQWGRDLRSGALVSGSVFEKAARDYYSIRRELGHNPTTLGIVGRVNDMMTQYNKWHGHPAMRPQDLMTDGEPNQFSGNESFIRQFMERIARGRGESLDSLPDFMRFFRDPPRAAPIIDELKRSEALISRGQGIPEGMYLQATAAIVGAGVNIPNLELVQNTAALLPNKMRQAEGRLRGIAGQRTYSQTFADPGAYDWYARSDLNTYAGLSKEQTVRDILSEFMINSGRRLLDPVNRDWKKASSTMDTVAHTSLENRGLNAWRSGILMRALRESGAIELDVMSREEVLFEGRPPTVVGQFANWRFFKDNPSPDELYDKIMSSRYRSPSDPGAKVPFSGLLESIQAEGQQYDQMGKELRKIQMKGATHSENARMLNDYVNRVFKNELVRYEDAPNLRASAPGFEEFGAVMRNRSGKEIRINEDVYLSPTQAVMGDITMSKIERAKLNGYNFVGTWQRQPEGARNSMGGLASRDDMNLPGETQITDGRTSETVRGRRLLSRAPDDIDELGDLIDRFNGPQDVNIPPREEAGEDRDLRDIAREAGSRPNEHVGDPNDIPEWILAQPHPLPENAAVNQTAPAEPEIPIPQRIARTEFTEAGHSTGGYNAQSIWGNVTPQRTNQPVEVGTIHTDSIVIASTVRDDRRGAGTQQAGTPFGPSDEPQTTQPRRQAYTQAREVEFDDQGRVRRVRDVSSQDEPFTTVGEQRTEPPTQNQKRMGGLMGAMSGIYWARRWWDIATGGVQQDIAGMGMQDFAPPALLGDRGTRYGNIISGAGTRQSIARMADQRGSYEEYGGITDLAFANSGNRSAARMRAAMSVSEGMAFGGIEIGQSIMQTGYFASQTPGPLQSMGPALQRAGAGIAIGGAILGGINLVGQAGFEMYNSGIFGNKKPDVPLSWGEVTRQIDKAATLAPIREQIAKERSSVSGLIPESPYPDKAMTPSEGFSSAISDVWSSLTGALTGANKGMTVGQMRTVRTKASDVSEDDALARLAETDPIKSFYLSYRGEPDKIIQSEKLATKLALAIGGTPEDYVPAMSRLGRMTGGALPNADLVYNFGLASQRQGYGFQEYIGMAEQTAQAYGFLGGSLGQKSIAEQMAGSNLTTYGLDRMQENASLFSSKYSSMMRWLPQSQAANIALNGPTSPEYYGALSQSFYASGQLGFDVGKEYAGGRLVNTGTLTNTQPSWNDRDPDQGYLYRRETYADMVSRMTKGLSAMQLTPMAPIIGTLLDKYPQFTEGALGAISPIISSLGNEGGSILGRAIGGDISAQSYAANFRPDIMKASGQLYQSPATFLSGGVGAHQKFGLWEGNPWNWMDRSNNPIYETSGQGFMSLGLGLANQGIVSQNMAPFRSMLSQTNAGTFNQMDWMKQTYGVTDQGLANAFLNGGTRESQEYMIGQQRANQWASIGIQYQQIANQRQYLWGANDGGAWNSPTSGSMWGLENQQRQLSNQSTMANFAYSRTMMNTQNQFAVQQEGLTAQRMGVTQGYQMWNLGFNQQGALQQRGWAREDWQYQDTTRGLSFSDNMTDIDEAIRRSSGYNRRVLLRQKERLGRDFGLEEGQIEKGRGRQEEVWAREDERYKKEKTYAEELISLDNQQFTLQKTQRQTFYDLESKNLNRNIEEYKKQFDLQEKQIALSRQYQAEQIEISEKLLGINTSNIALEQQYEDLVRKVTQQYSDWAGEVNNIAQNEQSKIIMESLTAMLNNLSGTNQNTINALTSLMTSIASITPTQAQLVEEIFGNMK